ncbi:MAG: OmpH family outer membrane protein [Deltaproteobacteria bacterium]|nr:OmpH family outer membrane protein [Deltaproteobacteria bacterium]
MKMYEGFLVLMVFLLTFSGTAYGADVQKIGVMDLQKIIDASNVGKRSAGEIKNQGKKMENVLKERGSEVEELKNTLDQKALVLSDEARKEKERDLRDKIEELRSLQMRYQNVLRDLNTNLSKQIMEDVFGIAEDIGKREGYTLIIDRRAGGIVYAPSALDITDKIIEAYNAVDAKRPKDDKAAKKTD